MIGQACNSSGDCGLPAIVCERPIGNCTCNGWKFRQQMTGPECEDLTPESAWALTAMSIDAVLTGYIWLYAFFMLSRVVRHQLKKVGKISMTHAITTLINCLIAMGLYCSMMIVEIIDMAAHDFSDADSLFAFYGFAECIGSTFFLLQLLNVSFMWIELCLASKHLQLVSKNLKRTRMIAWGMVSFLALTTTLLLLVGDAILGAGGGYLATNLLNWLSFIAELISFQYGFRRLKRVSDESHRLMGTDPTTDEKMMRIVKFANRVSLATLGGIIGMPVYIIGTAIESLALIWIASVMLFTGASWGTYHVISYIGMSLSKYRAEKNERPKKHGKPEQKQARRPVQQVRSCVLTPRPPSLRRR